MFCCSPFSTAIFDAGKKGISIVASSDTDARSFFIQSRACNIEDDHKLNNIPKEYDAPTLRVVTQIGIRFCPFCGEDLNEVVAECGDEFDVLSKSHEQFLMK